MSSLKFNLGCYLITLVSVIARKTEQGYSPL